MLDSATVKDRIAAAASLSPEAIDRLVGDVQAFLERQTGRYFGPVASHTEHCMGLGGYRLYLTDRVATGTPVVLERLSPAAAGTPIAAFVVLSQDHDPGSTLVRVDGQPWRAGAWYEVTYQRGYPRDAAPADVLRAALDLIAMRLNQEGLEGLESGAIGAFSFALADADGGPPTVQETVARWRRAVFA